MHFFKIFSFNFKAVQSNYQEKDEQQTTMSALHGPLAATNEYLQRNFWRFVGWKKILFNIESGHQLFIALLWFVQQDAV